jgi:hypothetical protein
MSWRSDVHCLVSACENREGTFELLPIDVIQVLRLGILATNLDEVRKNGNKVVVPTSIGLVVAAEMAWFAQHTRTIDAYDTFGAVDKYGIEVSAENYRKYTWVETSHWFHILSQIGERYTLSQAAFEILRTSACYLFARRRLGKIGQPFYVVLASSEEKRAIWMDIAYQTPTFSNVSPFVAHDDKKLLAAKTVVCFSCKKVCSRKCSKCKITPYCNRECQKKDYKDHKKTCMLQSDHPSLKDLFDKNKGVIYDVPEDIEYYLLGFGVQ